MTIRIGTRASQLALWQANELARLLRAAGHLTEIVTIRTTGDRRRDVSLASIGGKGLFIKELEDALDRRQIDLAVHSLKDVPSLIADRFELTAFLERADPRDVWIRQNQEPIDTLPPGSVVGTSSPRRRAQILARWPHLRVDDIRGNVETRIGKLRDGQYDAIILARAGLLRLGRSQLAAAPFDLDVMVPAAGQGVIAVEILRDRPDLRAALRAVNHPRTETAARVERGVLQQFGTRLDCTSPIAVHCSPSEGELEVRAFVSDLEGGDAIRLHERGSDPDELVTRTARLLVERGALERLSRASGA